ncbi:UNVERIFIED_CONTAM: hypothetical protein PYX00_011890 [Menopon gallinae]|uniref:Uncharacterized protein n=1 Tax=Menopon gallinae TaxID=328185 RepID=A0AAW2H919_9NEOP
MIAQLQAAHVMVSVATEILVSTLAPLFIYHYIALIAISSVQPVSLLLMAKKYRSNAVNKMVKALYVLSRILQVVGLFIVMSNVFVMQPGEKNCPSCKVNTRTGIICAYVFLLYYFFTTLLFTHIDIKNMAEHKS